MLLIPLDLFLPAMPQTRHMRIPYRSPLLHLLHLSLKSDLDKGIFLEPAHPISSVCALDLRQILDMRALQSDYCILYPLFQRYVLPDPLSISDCKKYHEER